MRMSVEKMIGQATTGDPGLTACAMATMAMISADAKRTVPGRVTGEVPPAPGREHAWMGMPALADLRMASMSIILKVLGVREQTIIETTGLAASFSLPPAAASARATRYSRLPLLYGCTQMDLSVFLRSTAREYTSAVWVGASLQNSMDSRLISSR